ncbi:MAG: hypothetical protein K8T89_00900 [Planctomycetes bacterium]|nr:hypothetical protein [Planctomycetota bacterium]
MNKIYLTSFLVIFGAAGLGYWLFAESTPREETSCCSCESCIPAEQANEKPNPERFPYFAGESAELIDLSRTFEPTGDELALKILLGAGEVAELLPTPRLLNEELPLPRVLADAGEEASSTPDRDDSFRVPFAFILERVLFNRFIGKSTENCEHSTP